MKTKRMARMRRLMKSRMHIKRLEAVRLCVYRSSMHIYAQVISPAGRVLAQASTVESALRQQLTSTGGVEAAKLIGRTVAEKALKNGVTKVAFDRAGFKFHGRVKALADAARDAGLEF